MAYFFNISGSKKKIRNKVKRIYEDVTVKVGYSMKESKKNAENQIKVCKNLSSNFFQYIYKSLKILKTIAVFEIVKTLFDSNKLYFIPESKTKKASLEEKHVLLVSNRCSWEGKGLLFVTDAGSSCKLILIDIIFIYYLVLRNSNVIRLNRDQKPEEKDHFFYIIKLIRLLYFLSKHGNGNMDQIKTILQVNIYWKILLALVKAWSNRISRNLLPFSCTYQKQNGPLNLVIPKNRLPF